MVHARRTTAADWAAVWGIWRAVVDAGDSYAWAPGTPEAEARRLWEPPPPAEGWVLDADGRIVATALLRSNQPGLGDHVANAAFMVEPRLGGRGYGRALALAVLQRARDTGYTAMQFNAVIASNTAAIHLWESLGFTQVGRIPAGFRHARLGPTDLMIMYREL